MSDQLNRWADTKKALEYHGVDQLLKDLRLELFLARDVIGDKANEYDDDILRGIHSILGSIRERLEDLDDGRLPFQRLYLGDEQGVN